MIHIAIPYFSGTGHAKRLAELVAEGVTRGGAMPTLVDVATITPADWALLAGVDAIIFGAPTHMGSLAAPFKQFMDDSSDIWFNRQWANKLAGGFTTGVSHGGDKLNSLMQLSIFAAQHGMIWVGQDEIGAPVVKENAGINTSGIWLGLGATDSADKAQLINEGDAETARRFGARVADAAMRWS